MMKVKIDKLCIHYKSVIYNKIANHMLCNTVHKLYPGIR